MTVSATPRKAGPFAGTGAQTAFPFAFKIFATTDVVVTTVVTATSVQATPVNGVDYTVAMNADQENAPGGTVNMVVAPLVGVSLVISSAVPSTQSVAVQNNGGFFPAVFNTEFDRLTVLIQQLEERAGRALSAPITASGVNLSVSPVANAVLVWDGLAQNLITIPQSTLAANLVYNNATYTAAIAVSLSTVATRPVGDNTTNTANTAFVQAALPSAYAFRNRLMNGDMRIDQRNNGASGITYGYAIDRWFVNGTQSAKLTWGRNLNAITPPVGFTNYLGFQSSTAYAVLAGDGFHFRQPVEGLNVADLAWGTATAKPVVLTLLAYSSLTGNHGGALQNAAGTRSYPFLYNIPVANTWTAITVAIPGDTAGVWATDTNVGVHVQFGLGAGATFSGPAGAWAGAGVLTANGAVSLVGTNGATLYVTGVQFEVGTAASPFERRSYGVEFGICQRYFQRFGTGAAVGALSGFCASNTAVLSMGLTFPAMRAGPTLVLSEAGVINQLRDTGAGTLINFTTFSLPVTPSSMPFTVLGGAALTVGHAYDFDLTLTAEL